MIRLGLLTMMLAMQCTPAGTPTREGEPKPVSVTGYDGDIMEPFLSRDGQTLFFNNRNDPPEKTDLHWAMRLNDAEFRYRGKVDGANSASLDGVATSSANGKFCFVSTRSYDMTLATVYCGAWSETGLSNVTLQSRAAALIPGRVAFDVELAASGEYAVIADGRFTGGAVPVAADLRLARRDHDGGFRLDPASDWQFAAINTSALEYAAGLTADGLAMCFTRLEGSSASLWISRRLREDAAFEAPRAISGTTGFVEACTFAPDGAIYFHRLNANRFEIWRLAAPQ